jgi:hypothetical protein
MSKNESKEQTMTGAFPNPGDQDRAEPCNPGGLQTSSMSAEPDTFNGPAAQPGHAAQSQEASASSEDSKTLVGPFKDKRDLFFAKPLTPADLRDIRSCIEEHKGKSSGSSIFSILSRLGELQRGMVTKQTLVSANMMGQLGEFQSHHNLHIALKAGEVSERLRGIIDLETWDVSLAASLTSIAPPAPPSLSFSHGLSAQLPLAHGSLKTLPDASIQTLGVDPRQQPVNPSPQGSLPEYSIQQLVRSPFSDQEKVKNTPQSTKPSVTPNSMLSATFGASHHKSDGAAASDRQNAQPAPAFGTPSYGQPTPDGESGQKKAAAVIKVMKSLQKTPKNTHVSLVLSQRQPASAQEKLDQYYLRVESLNQQISDNKKKLR